MIRVLMIGMALVGCVTSSPTPAVPLDERFSAEPVAVTATEGAYGRALQAALAASFQPISSDAATGLFTVERTQVDDALTEEKNRYFVGGTPPTYSRRITLSVIVDGSRATMTPSVVVCKNRRCGPLLETQLNASEADAIARIQQALTTPTTSR